MLIRKMRRAIYFIQEDITTSRRELADRGFRVIVADDCCTTLSEEMHNAALLAFRLAFGRVRKSDEIAGLFSS